MIKPIIKTDIPDLPLMKRGKVRDIYDLDTALLMVATDRISAFDVVMPNPIPDKGKILNQISLFWFKKMRPLVPNHLLTQKQTDKLKRQQPEIAKILKQNFELLIDRSMIVEKAEPLAIECVVRGYISGSGWKSYQEENGTVCGIKLAPGLRESEKILPKPIFTPSTKAEGGEHDKNIPFSEAAELVGLDIAKKVRDLSLQIYQRGARLALKQGIIIADTKFEFGLTPDGDLVLIDEVLTPDSSRFWQVVNYEPGRGQKSFDKQYLRDYLKTLDWNEKSPGPDLPLEVIKKTAAKYKEAYYRILAIR